MLNAGQTVDDFRLDELVHRGRGTLVFAATDLTLRRRAAFKVLLGPSASDPAARERFVREAQTAAALDTHPHIVTVYRWGAFEDAFYFVTEFVFGIGLEELIERQPGSEGLNTVEAIALLRQIAGALDFAHRRGVVHRDIKPANIMVRMTESTRSAQLIDFGITKVGEELDQSMVGTPDYIAPEVIIGEAVDWRADIYSLGCTAFEMLSGTPPFAAAPDDATRLAAHLGEPVPRITTLRPSLPAGFDAVFERALSKQAEDRYESCEEFVEALAAEVPEAANEYDRGEMAGDEAATPDLTALVVVKRRRWPGLVITAALLAAAAALGWVLTAGIRNPGVDVAIGRQAVVPTTSTIAPTTTTTTIPTTTTTPPTTLPISDFGDVIGEPVVPPGNGSPASNFAFGVQTRVFDTAQIAAPGSPAAAYAEWVRLVGVAAPADPVVATADGYEITADRRVQLSGFTFDVSGLPLTFDECIDETCRPLDDLGSGLIVQTACTAGADGCPTYVSESGRLALVQVLGVNLRSPRFSLMYRLEPTPPPEPVGTEPPPTSPPVPQVESIINAQGTARYLANGSYVVIEFSAQPQPGAVETLTITYADGGTDRLELRF